MKYRIITMSSSNTQLPDPLLILDASCPMAQAGLLRAGQPPSWIQLEGEVAATLFEAVQTLLKSADLPLEAIQSWAFSEGPGSTMGIRISGMAIQSWQALRPRPLPLYAFRSLDAASRIVANTHKDLNSWLICSDLRKTCWNSMPASREALSGDIQVQEEKDLPSEGQRFFLQQRLFSPSQPANCINLDYDLSKLGNEDWQALLHPVEKPQALQTTTTTFKKWKPERHRAPV